LYKFHNDNVLFVVVIVVVRIFGIRSIQVKLKDSYMKFELILLLKRSTPRLNWTNYVLSSTLSLNVEDEVLKMKTKLATVNGILAYIASKLDVSEHFAQWQLVWYKHRLMMYKFVYLNFYYNIIIVYFIIVMFT